MTYYYSAALARPSSHFAHPSKYERVQRLQTPDSTPEQGLGFTLFHHHVETSDVQYVSIYSIFISSISLLAFEV